MSLGLSAAWQPASSCSTVAGTGQARAFMDQRYAVSQPRDAAPGLNCLGVSTLLIALTCAVCRHLLFAGPRSDNQAHTHSSYGEITRCTATTPPVWMFTGTEHVTVVFPLAAAAVAAMPEGHVATAAVSVPNGTTSQRKVALQPPYKPMVVADSRVAVVSSTNLLHSKP